MKLRHLLILCLLPLFADSAYAQSSVSVNLGASYANGSLTIELLPPSNGNVGVTHIFLDSTGQATVITLVPGSTYGFWASKADGSALLYGRLTVTGQPQVITAALLPVSSSASASIPFLGVPTGSCTSLQNAINTLTGDFYSCVAGVWIKVGPGGNPGVLTSPVTTPNPLNFDVTLGFKGPYPYTDVSRYGARSLTVNSNIPGVPGITANITSGTATATVSTASCPTQSDGCFVNGTYAVIFGAGAANGMSTPGAPTVTPSVAAAGTGTSLVANAPASATTYNYQIIARNKAGGLTAASTVGTTATGSASLGPQSVPISGWTRSGTTVTATASSPHTLSAGSMVYMFSSPLVASDNGNFGGWFVVATVPDNTHFTYLTGADTAYGAPTVSVAGGTANWFNCNHLTWTAVAGAYEYYIYGRTGGSLTLLGVSKVQSTVNGMSLDLTWDDFGSPMMDGITLPYFVPNTPPVAALANPLTAKVTAGGGTTTLTLDTNASTTVTGATILMDNAPAIVAAATSVQSFGLLQISGTYLVNSYCAIPINVSMNVSGNLILNDTFEIGAQTKIYGNRGVQGFSNLSFGWNVGGYFTVARGNPGIYSRGPNGQINMESIEIDMSANAGVGMLLDDAGNSSFKFVNVGVAGPMGIGIISRAHDFFQDWDHVAVIAPQGVLGSSATPAWYFTPGNGDVFFSNIALSGRGFFMQHNIGGAGHDVFFTGNNREQGGMTPFWTDYVGSGAEGGQISFKGIELDTMAQAYFANLSPFAQVYSVNFGALNGSPPANGFAYVTGTPVGSVNGVISGQNYNAIQGSNFTSNPVQVNGAGTIGYALATPGAPSAVVSAGGSFPIGTFSYVVTFMDAVSRETPLSAYINFTTTTGNQTVTVTPPAQIPGAVSWRPYRCNANAAQCSLANIPAGCASTASVAFGSTFVDTFNFGCNTQPSTGGSVASLSSAGLAGSKVTLAPTLFASLGTPVNSQIKFCPDCVIANPCAGSGTGAFAQGINGAWSCSGTLVGAAAWSALTPGTNSVGGTFAASGNTWDFSAATLKGRVGAGCVTTVVGDWCTDTTNNNILDFVNGVKVYRGVFATLPTNGNAIYATVSLGQLLLSSVSPIGGTFAGGQQPILGTSTNAATNDVWCINPSGITVNCTLGIPPVFISSTPVAISSLNRGNELTLLSGAVNLTIPQAGSAGYTSSFYTVIWNLSAAGPVTLTPTTSVITGGSTNVSAAASAVINVGDFCTLTSSSGNYFLACDGGRLAAIFTGTAVLGTSAISSATCAAAVTVGATGVATTDVITVGFNGDPTAVTGYIPAASGMLTIIPYPTTNNVNFKVCNNTAGSITPGAVTLNWKVLR